MSAEVKFARAICKLQTYSVWKQAQQAVCVFLMRLLHLRENASLFMDEETEVQRMEVPCAKSHN